MQIIRGYVAGMIGGAVGAWVMNNWQEPSAMKAKQAVPARVQTRNTPAKQKAGAHHHNGGHQREGSHEEPTVQVAEAVSRNVFGHELGKKEKAIAGPAVHYGYAMLVGGLYGGLAEVWPNVKIGMGMGYGMALWALGHEAALPMLKLAPSPLKEPVKTHADTLSSHICFGMTLDCVRRIAKWFI